MLQKFLIFCHVCLPQNWGEAFLPLCHCQTSGCLELD